MFPALYHAHHSRNTEDIPFWLGLASQSGDPVLELGCGTGRVLIPLLQAGHRVVGIDHDPEMLKFLQASILMEQKNMPQLVLGDISRFKLAMRFPVIILPCNTLSTLDENQRKSCLRCVAEHLRAGGIFSASLPNPQTLAHLPARSAPELEDEFFHPQTGNPVQVSSCWRRTKNTFILTWTYDHLFPDGYVKRLSVETAHQLIPADTYLKDIREAGMKDISLYGDYDQSAYTDDSPVLIIQARA